jgi:hypothetical protein
MLRRFTALLAFPVSLFGCSDPAPAPAQGALHVVVSPRSEGSCPALGIQYSLPSGPDALHAIVTSGGENRSTGEVYRVVDGDPDVRVSCTVRQIDETTFELNASLRKRRSVNFSVSGTISTSGGGVELSEWDIQSNLPATAGGEDCTIDLTDRYIAPGAIWARFTCPQFNDGLIQCQANGHFVFENCDR